MPKLTIDQRTKGKAIAALFELYKAEPGFMSELKEIQRTYSPVVEHLINSGIPEWVHTRANLAEEEFSQVRNYFFARNGKMTDTLADKLYPLFSILTPQLTSQLDSYVKSLADLASRWKLNASWAGYALVINHILDIIPKYIKDKEIPIELVEPFLPAAPLPSLIFEVKAYEFMFSGRQEIQDRFTQALVGYEKKLKSIGWREVPAAIEKHARWWFEHYVHGKTYAELAQEYLDIGGESIKREVWKFSRLLDIKIK
jgi:hypothetical protein